MTTSAGERAETTFLLNLSFVAPSEDGAQNQDTKHSDESSGHAIDKRVDEVESWLWRITTNFSSICSFINQLMNQFTHI